MLLLLFLSLLHFSSQSSINDQSYGGSFTVQVPPKGKFCVYENFNVSDIRNMKYRLNMRVLKGKDVDLRVTSSGQSKKVDIKKKSRYNGEIEVTEGEWEFCVGNTFSTVSTKIVFFSLENTQVESLKQQARNNKANVMTYPEAAAETINRNMHYVQGRQTEMRLREAGNRHFANSLYSNVNFWSAVQAVAVPALSISQVMIVRRMFAPGSRKGIGA